MQKSKIILLASGILIAVGLVLSVVGNQVILEGVNQGDGKISLEQTLTISSDFDVQETSIGIFAVRIMEFQDNTFSVKVLDPFDIEIISEKIEQETIEEKFDIFESGTYKLIIESTSNHETPVFAAIGPLPDAGKKALGFISVYVLISGMIGLIGSGIYAVKSRKRSV
ncbi:MAG: hypothetical protein ACE5GR_03320 [Nitrosopumilus sp.]